MFYNNYTTYFYCFFKIICKLNVLIYTKFYILYKIIKNKYSFYKSEENKNMKTKRQRIKELEDENRRLKNQNHDLNFDLMLTRTIAQMEKSFLSHQIIMKTYNPEIRLPGNDSIFYSDLNEVQLSYLKSLKNADKEKKNAK